jgi:hypothetical protein
MSMISASGAMPLLRDVPTSRHDAEVREKGDHASLKIRD